MAPRQSFRDDAPAYLLRYEAKRGARALAPSDPSQDDFVARARRRATERALEQIASPESPPGRTVAFARETTSPRELQYPESFRERSTGHVEVRLIRHGQTQGYITDGGLSPLGKWQAHRKGQDLAKGIREGQTIRFPHAPTARAEETAIAVREGVLQALSRYGIGDVVIEEPTPNEAFKNFQVYIHGREMDVTAAFQEFAAMREEHNRDAAGDRLGWVVEMDRFYRIENAGGDPITSWLSVPMHYFEPPTIVVRRWWKGIIELCDGAAEGTKCFVSSHSGPIRAFAASAVGHDPGEPYNVEDVRLRVNEDRRHAVLTYRGRGVEMEIPAITSPTWFSQG